MIGHIAISSEHYFQTATARLTVCAGHLGVGQSCGFDGHKSLFSADSGVHLHRLNKYLHCAEV
jgi:hypothetical protein